MKIEDMRINGLESIRLEHTDTDGNLEIKYISFKTYEKSFVAERWTGERRYNKVYSLFGLNPNYITVNNGYGRISRRRFFFPSSIEEAIENHKKSVALKGGK